MGASSEAWIHFRCKEEYYNSINEENKLNFEIVKVEVEGVDYSHDELWTKLKSESVKSYKKLKEREYKLNNK
jgi:hypothetical protein